MNDSTQSIIHSAKRFFSGTMLSRIAGMLRDMAMAYAFGAHEAVAAFLVAFRFSHLLRRLLGEGALQSALIPQFEKVREKSSYEASLFFRNLTLSLSTLLSLIVVLTMVVLWGVLSWGNLDAGNAEIVQLTLLMMPSLIFICLFGINASLLQCQKSYFTPSIAPVAFNLFWIVGTLFLWNLIPTEAMRWLTLFVNFACIAQWALTVPETLKILRELGSVPFSQLQLLSKNVLALLAPLSLGIVGVGAAQINNALDAVFARYADAEGPAYLWYSIRLQQLPLALFGIAISGAVLPPLSRAAKGQDWVKFREFLDFAVRKTMALMVPITFAIFLMGDSSINLIYGHGDFDAQAVANTTLCLWGYGFGLFPMAMTLILAPAFYAQGDYRTPTQASVLSIGLNIFLNYVLISIFGFGAASVALATSLSAWLNMFLLGWNLKLTYSFSSQLKANCLKVCFACIVASCLVLAYNHYVIEQDFIGGILQGELLAWSRNSLEQAKVIIAQTVLFFSSLAFLSYVMGINELSLKYANKLKN